MKKLGKANEILNADQIRSQMRVSNFRLVSLSAIFPIADLSSSFGTLDFDLRSLHLCTSDL